MLRESGIPVVLDDAPIAPSSESLLLVEQALDSLELSSVVADAAASMTIELDFDTKQAVYVPRGGGRAPDGSILLALALAPLPANQIYPSRFRLPSSS